MGGISTPTLSEVLRSDRIAIEDRGSEIGADVASVTLKCASGKATGLRIDALSRHCLIEAMDPRGLLLKQEVAVADFQETRP